ncbi:hypothetical protein BAL199_05024 [alpha proteobacterium BAL199]|nr:hypothetical protein BAL199_05024 [alpha proteobacterium BAL199]
MIGAVAGLGGLLLLAACGQVPQPFSKDEANLAKAPFLIAPTTEGVVVLPVEGVPADTGQLIADLAAEALQKQDVAANVRISNRASLFLSGAGRRLPDGRMEIAWTLARPDGTVIGERTDIVASDAQLSESTAKVAAWLRPQKPDVVVIVPKVTVYPVDGAPGDGNDLLRRALELALDRAPVQLTTDVAENGHVVQGDVSITRLNTGNDRVVISWIVLDAHGKQIGVVDQDNVVPGGSLDRSWGAVAAPIADAALGGIVALLKESEAARAAVGIGPATLTN